MSKAKDFPVKWFFYFAAVLIITPRPIGSAQDNQPSGAAASTEGVAQSSPALAAIQRQSQAFVDAFNGHDAKAIAQLWTDDAEYIDDSGNVYEGRDAIEQVYAEVFNELPDVNMQLVIDSLRQISKGVVIEDGRALVDPPPPGAPGVSHYTAVHVNVDGQWRMASVRDRWVETAVTRDSTADLDWLIGTWAAEEHGVRMQSVCRWVADNNFVERKFTTIAVDGTTSGGVQLIGWNPAAASLQSWEFSPDGGHAVGTWSMTQSGWIAQMNGVTGDGLPTTSVNSLRRLDDNAYVWQSVQRTLGGKAVPDTDEVVIKRVSSGE